MDPNFVIHLKREATVVTESQIRRDPNFNHQLYFYSAIPTDGNPNKFGLYFSQAIAASADPTDQSVRVVDFLKRKRNSPLPYPFVTYGIDERAAKFYLGFRNDRYGTVFLLRIFDLDFDLVDHLGYRRIRVRGGDCQYIVEHDPIAGCVVIETELCPFSGKLFGHCQVMPDGKFLSTLAEIEQPKVNDSALKTKRSDHLFETANGWRVLNACGSMFSKLNHLLLFYCFSRNHQSSNCEQLVFICSYDTENLQLVQRLAFNPVEFVSQFLSAVQVRSFWQDRPPWASDAWAIGVWLRMVGYVHKYVLFVFWSYVLAVKWPRNWYMGEHLPPVQLSRVLDTDQDLLWLPSISRVPPVTLIKEHLYVLFRMGDKPYEKRLALSPKFKDYRHCAYCGEVENRKRRNKQGKRIAKFKVCRLCKKLNLHVFYLDPELACHYCSDECQKKHWKTHKNIHKRSKLNRKTARAKTRNID